MWTDPPGSLSASRALVNDLDLVVVAPNGTALMGNGWFAWDETHGPSAFPDADNNCEQVSAAPSLAPSLAHAAAPLY